MKRFLVTSLASLAGFAAAVAQHSADDIIIYEPVNPLQSEHYVGIVSNGETLVDSFIRDIQSELPLTRGNIKVTGVSLNELDKDTTLEIDVAVADQWLKEYADNIVKMRTAILDALLNEFSFGDSLSDNALNNASLTVDIVNADTGVPVRVFKYSDIEVLEAYSLPDTTQQHFRAIMEIIAASEDKHTPRREDEDMVLIKVGIEGDFLVYTYEVSETWFDRVDANNLKDELLVNFMGMTFSTPRFTKSAIDIADMGYGIGFRFANDKCKVVYYSPEEILDQVVSVRPDESDVSGSMAEPEYACIGVVDVENRAKVDEFVAKMQGKLPLNIMGVVEFDRIEASDDKFEMSIKLKSMELDPALLLEREDAVRRQLLNIVMNMNEFAEVLECNAKMDRMFRLNICDTSSDHAKVTFNYYSEEVMECVNNRLNKSDYSKFFIENFVSNLSLRLPMQIDEVTLWTKVYPGEMCLTMEYEVLSDDIASQVFNIAANSPFAFKKLMTPDISDNETFLLFTAIADKGYGVRYLYKHPKSGREASVDYTSAELRDILSRYVNK